MTVSQAGKNLSGKLSGIYDSREAVKIAHMVMEKITGLTNTERLVNKELLLNAAQENQIELFSAQLLSHMPVQYVLQEAWFSNMKFYVDEHVLIPRPETEELVEAVIEDMKPSPGQNSSVLDIGTGSGCIAISIKKKLPGASVYALDISNKALAIAAKNAKVNNVDVEFFQADILHFQAYSISPRFDVIVSNPPYISQNEAAGMFPNVLLFEPHQALFVPDDDALFFYRSIADFALQNLKQGKGKLYFEINEMMVRQLSELLAEKGFSEISVKKDLQGKDRVVSAVLK